MPGEVKDVPRDRTVIHIIAGREGKYVGHQIHNPYSTSAGETVARVLMREPLYYFSAFENKEIAWLATDWEYADDFMTLTYKLRDGVTWSDGETFDCDDVAYTYNTLSELGPKVRWGTDTQQFVDNVECTDSLTAVFSFKRPAPKWHHFISFKFDIGIFIVPEHVYSAAGDWTEFRDFDLDKGWPLTTGPWRVVAASPEQIVFDRVESEDDWWASKQGYWKFPEVERFIQLPLVGGATQAAQALVKNEVDTAGPGGLLSVSLHEEVQAQNPKIITHNLREKPYGFLNWYTANIEINNERTAVRRQERALGDQPVPGPTKDDRHSLQGRREYLQGTVASLCGATAIHRGHRAPALGRLPDRRLRSRSGRCPARRVGLREELRRDVGEGRRTHHLRHHRVRELRRSGPGDRRAAKARGHRRFVQHATRLWHEACYR